MPPTPYYRHDDVRGTKLERGFQVILRVPWEVEESSLQAVGDTCHCVTGRRVRGDVSSDLVFNEEASLHAASDACHHAIGWRVRGVVSSTFWRFFEYGGFL
jgi:hypothetical protein